ncbi:MAG TPA: glycosyltransferase family 39 protein [Candidatus Gastranaerophilales bacterium]|nr:glycosyltransferase family 39 protein [Candidatus Gastranaerophilales bacterium]
MKIKTLKPNVYFIALIFIVIIGSLIRFSGIDKADGLWYDEILSYSLSKNAFPFGIIDTVMKNEFQGVLHYLYLGVWMIFFGESDLSLRLSSFIFGIMLIPAIYLLGKEVHSKGFGLFIALMTAFNPLLVYYSQEVRPYSLLSFLGVLSFLFLFRALRQPDRLNFFIYGLANVLILYTYTIGFVFVFLQVAVLLLYLKFTQNMALKKFAVAALSVLILYLPYLASVISNFSYYFSSAFIEPFFYSDFTFYGLLIMLQDWFTPLLFGIYRYNDGLYKEIFLSGLNGQFVFFLLIMSVVLTLLFGLIACISKEKRLALLIFLPCFAFLGFEFLADLFGSFCLVTRHTLLVFPLILLLCCLGLYKFANRKGVAVFISGLLLFYCLNFIGEDSVARWERGGIKPVVGFLTGYNLGKDDIVLVPSHSGFIKKCLPTVNTLDINYMEAVFLDKSKLSLKKFIANQEIINKTNKNNSHILLKTYLIQEKPSVSLENYLNKSITGLKKGRYLIIIRKTDYASFEENELKEILENPQKYKNTAMFRMFTSKIVNDLIKISGKSLDFIEKKEVKSIWTVYIFRKELI